MKVPKWPALASICFILVSLFVILPAFRNLDNQSRNSVTFEKYDQLNERYQRLVTLLEQYKSNCSIQPENKRQEMVKEAFLHAWNGYKQYAWGHDDLRPVSASFQDWIGMGATIIDSLSTLWIMNLKDEFNLAKKWVETQLDFKRLNRDINVFEIIIRVVGGLCSAYDLSGEKIFLTKAIELADLLLPAFESPSGLPSNWINLQTGVVKNAGVVILAEVGTLQLEFLHLSAHSGNPIYKQKAMKIIEVLDKAEKNDNLYPLRINSHSGSFIGNQVSFGGLGDSFFEYLLKIDVFANGNYPNVRNMWSETMKSSLNKLLTYSKNPEFTILGQLSDNGMIIPKVEHLSCFVPGMLILGSRDEKDENFQTFLKKTAVELTKTCNAIYKLPAIHLGAESATYKGTGFVIEDGHYRLRPETIESYFYMYRFTHDNQYREMAWDAFLGINTSCRTEFGFAELKNTNFQDKIKIATNWEDVQHSFFLAETLKYLFLIFGEDHEIDLDHWVFNTEAHPLKILRNL